MDDQWCGLCGRPIRAGEARTDLLRAGHTAHVACAEAWQRERDAHQGAAAARGPEALSAEGARK
jgi:hypothetical protein